MSTSILETTYTAPDTSTDEKSPANSLRHVFVLAKRSLIKTWRTPEALVDVTLQPIIFLVLFTYIFGGAIAGGSTSSYLQFLLPGLLGQSIAMAGVAIGQNLNADIEKGVFDRFRSLPIARSAPLVGAVVAGLFAVLIALVSNGVTGALIILAVILGVQQLEGNVLSPWLQARSMQLHSAVVLLSVVDVSDDVEAGAVSSLSSSPPQATSPRARGARTAAVARRVRRLVRVMTEAPKGSVR